MDINTNKREKVKVEEIEFGKSFHVIDSNNYFMRINIVFKDMVVEPKVYGANLDTGEVELFDKETIVERVDLMVVER